MPVNQGIVDARDDAQRQRAREHATYQYFCSMEEGDLDTVVMVLEQAETDPILERMLLELDAYLVEEEEEEREREAPGPSLADSPPASGPLGDVGHFLAPSCVSPAEDLVECQNVLQLILALAVEHDLSADDPLDPYTLVADDASMPLIEWEALWPPRAEPSGDLYCSLHLPNAREWAREPAYSRPVARALIRAYVAISRAPGTLRAYWDAHTALVDWEPYQMSTRQRMCVDYILGICYTAIGEHQTALEYLSDAHEGARHLGDWGGAAECAHLSASISAALDDCTTAADYYTMCLDCLDHYQATMRGGIRIGHRPPLSYPLDVGQPIALV